MCSFLQLGIIAGVYYTLATFAFMQHRTALGMWTAVGLVFSIFGADKGIYGDLGSRVDSAAEAFGAGYLILAFVNVRSLFSAFTSSGLVC